ARLAVVECFRYAVRPRRAPLRPDAAPFPEPTGAPFRDPMRSTSTRPPPWTTTPGRDRGVFSFMLNRTLSRRVLAGTLGAGAVTLGAGRAIVAQDASPSASPTEPIEPVEIPSFTVPDDAIEVNIGSLAVMIYSPMFVAYDKGYFAERGLDVNISPINSGTDLTVLTSTNELQISIS